jgi:RHS repeat-associated protein
VKFTYTLTGRRATMNDASGTTTYAYDERDRLANMASPQGTLSYTYDDTGKVLTLRSSNANGVSVDYSYDVLDRLSSVTDNRFGATPTTYNYDANGNLTGVRYPNNVQTTYTYNTLNRLTQMGSVKSATSLASYAYSLDATGRRLSVAEQGGRKVTYTYDALYRLTGETVTGDAASNGAVNYTYDAVGNRLSRVSSIPGVDSRTSTYDANDRLNSDLYDANGNTTNSNGVDYRYDFENHLKEVGGGAVQYVYDGDGNRVAKTVNGITTRYLVDSLNPTGYAQVVEELQGGQVVRQYTYGHDLISQRQQVGGQWQTSFYGYDGHGSVRYLTDPSGAVTDTYTYDAFGALLSRTGTTSNEYLFAGERLDPETGLYYLRARYMNPAAGRFWSMDRYEGEPRDPISLHKYLYANVDPVNFVDPTGNFSVSEMSTVTGMTNTLNTITSFINTAMRVHDRIQMALDIYDYAMAVSNVLAALGEPSPALMRTALEAALRKHLGEGVSGIVDGFQQVASKIGPNWSDISSSLVGHAPYMAGEIIAKTASHMPGWLAEEKAGRLKMIFYAPTAPGGKQKDNYLEIKQGLLVAASLGGGRLFGVGVRRPKGINEQIFRVDYFDGRPDCPGPMGLHVHYHILSDKGHDDPRRTIWP